GLFQVDRDSATAPIGGSDPRFAVRAVDTDDVGAHIGQEHGREGPRAHPGHFEDTQPCEWSRHVRAFPSIRVPIGGGTYAGHRSSAGSAPKAPRAARSRMVSSDRFRCDRSTDTVSSPRRGTRRLSPVADSGSKGPRTKGISVPSVRVATAMNGADNSLSAMNSGIRLTREYGIR